MSRHVGDTGVQHLAADSLRTQILPRRHTPEPPGMSGVLGSDPGSLGETLRRFFTTHIPCADELAGSVDGPEDGRIRTRVAEHVHHLVDGQVRSQHLLTQ